MRFFADGVDIPDNLIRAVSGGSVIFLCGAGVSRAANMPSFRGLTEHVYAVLGESRENEAAERVAFDRQEYDRVLRSLEKRTHRPGTPSRVRDAVASRLVTPSGGLELPRHASLLTLSRNRDGRPRLLTTNFDTLFERAVPLAGLGAVPSHAGRSIPRPGGDRDHGILHLHGRIADEELMLQRTELTLTSADFGEAYLRDGWASRYVEDRMRLNTMVLVGYGAEDAALRLLLETLDADRERFPDLKDIYAMDRRTDDSASIWKAKGIRPVEFSDYSAIYATLAEWARYSLNPIEYRRTRVRSILAGQT